MNKDRVRIEIDLNSRDNNGHVIAKLANNIVKPGDSVIVFESEDVVEADAIVVTVDTIRQRVALAVHWDTMRDG